MLIVSGCATPPTRYDQVSEGHWEARALIKDKKRSRSYVVNFDINAKKDQDLRLDVTDTLGGHLASLVMSQDDLRYIIVKQKKFYQGKPRSKALRPVLRFPMEPKVFHNILFDQPIANKNWSCTEGEDGFIKSCRNLISRTTIQWSSRVAKKKTVKVDHRLGSLQINFSAFRPKVQDRERLFELKAPPGFKRQVIQ